MKILVNGCFDLLHEGHIFLISKALEYSYTGEVLFLINSDKSIKELKGSDRPYEDVITRGGKVERVVQEWCYKHRDFPKINILIFNNEKELEEQIDKFAPHMIIKGNDRTNITTIVGFNKWPILIIPRLKDSDNKDISTTRKIREKNETL
jgi:D-beta-D-heptose 7-phosphate kinase/D-beta-D-heptose 1-phosphate adenosyltransferase